MYRVIYFISALAGLAQAHSNYTIATDPQVYGPSLDIVHLYFGQWPTGVTVSASGRIFSNFPAGLDKGNVNDGSNGRYQVAELTSFDAETAYPNITFNTPPGGSINYTVYPPVSANYQDYLIGVQSVVIDSKERLWILDTGRAQSPNGTMLPSSYGGPKLIGVDLSTDTVIKTIVFPPTAVYPDSYPNDIRFDLRSNLTESGQGVAYITDSSNSGRTGIIVVDLGTGEAWRHLEGHPSTRPEQQIVSFQYGEPLYAVPGPGMPISYNSFGADGIALSVDGEELFYSPTGSRYLYSVPTKRLLDRSVTSEVLAQAAIQNRGQHGVADGLETDTNGFIYNGYSEQNSVTFYNPANATVSTFVRDPRINWSDTFSVAGNSLYFTVNQLPRSPMFYPGTDRREKPYVLFKAPLPNNATKVHLA